MVRFFDLFLWFLKTGRKKNLTRLFCSICTDSRIENRELINVKFGGNYIITRLRVAFIIAMRVILKLRADTRELGLLAAVKAVPELQPESIIEHERGFQQLDRHACTG